MFYTSPSDIRSFLQCPRQWAFKKVHRKERITIPGMQQGTALDLKVQRHFEGKGPSLLVDPVVDAQMRALVPELPPPGTSRQARLRVELVPGEIGLQGALDYFIEPNVIGDTKTCAGDRRTAIARGWCLTEETLPKDHQALAYTLMVCRQTGMDHAICRWHYVCRRLPKPDAWTVGVYVLREDAERWAEEIAIPAARAMLRLLAERPPIEEIPHEPEGACGMGSPRRCGYAGMCPVLKGPIGTGRELMGAT